MESKKQTEVARVEYNDIGERQIIKVKAFLTDAGSSRYTRPLASESTEAGLDINDSPDSSFLAQTSSLDVRVGNTINFLRTLLQSKILRDASSTGAPQPMKVVFREHFTTSFGVTAVGKKKMQSLLRAVKELQPHSSFLRVIGQTLGSPEMDSLGPGQSAVYFGFWSLYMVEHANENEELSLSVPLSDFVSIFQAACDQFLSVPSGLLLDVETHLVLDDSQEDESRQIHVADVDETQERVVNVLEKYDQCCLEVGKLLFSSAALPQDILVPKGSSANTDGAYTIDRKTRNKSMLTPLMNLKLLLDDCILHDATRVGILPIEEMATILVIWQKVIHPDIAEDHDKARLLAQCFCGDEDETSVVYTELLSFVHERILESAETSSMDDILDTVCSFERGVDGVTVNLLARYIENAILDKRKRLGRELDESAAASKAPKNCDKASLMKIDPKQRQSKTPLYIAEQLLYQQVSN